MKPTPKKDWIKNHNNWILWGAPLLMTLLVIATVYRFSQVSFLSDDDFVLMASLSGKLTGEPSFYCPYTNPIFAWMLSGLYTLSRQVNWYVLYHILTQTASITTIGFCTLYLCRKHGVKLWKGLLLFLWMLLGLFIFPISSISFTVTAIVTASAGVALLLTVDIEADSVRKQRRTLAAAGVFTFFGYILRPLPVAAVYCFLLLAVAYLAVDSWRKHRTFKRTEIRRITAFVVCLTLVLAGAFSTQVMEERRNKDYIDFNLARSLYMDYPHQEYEDMIEVYNDLGISEELANILDQWCFADEKIDTEVLKTLVEKGSIKQDRSLRQSLAIGLGLLKNNKFVLSQVVICGLLALIILYRCRNKRFCQRYWLELLTLACAAGGAFLQCFILCWFGRFLQQVFFAASIPCIITGMLFAVKLNQSELPKILQPRKDSEERWNIRRGAVLLMSLIVMALTCYKPVNYTFHSEVNEEKRHSIEEVREFYRYIQQHPEDSYMYDAASKYDIDAFPENPDKDYHNALAWGDSYYHSPIYDAQLKAMGREQFYLEDLLEDDTYFISNPENYSIGGVLNYMCAEFGVAVAKAEDEIGDHLYVYSFRRPSYDPDYTGFYESHGMKYYIQDGKPKTGWFKVDGETYYGQPIGKDAPVIQREIDDQDYLLTVGGSLTRGCVNVDDKVYMFDAEGSMVSGWAYVKDSWRYFQRDGQLLCSEWLIYNDTSFYMDQEGKVAYACGKMGDKIHELFSQ